MIVFNKIFVRLGFDFEQIPLNILTNYKNNSMK